MAGFEREAERETRIQMEIIVDEFFTDSYKGFVAQLAFRALKDQL